MVLLTIPRGVWQGPQVVSRDYPLSPRTPTRPHLRLQLPHNNRASVTIFSLVAPTTVLCCVSRATHDRLSCCVGSLLSLFCKCMPICTLTVSTRTTCDFAMFFPLHTHFLKGTCVSGASSTCSLSGRSRRTSVRRDNRRDERFTDAVTFQCLRSTAETTKCTARTSACWPRFFSITKHFTLTSSRFCFTS